LIHYFSGFKKEEAQNMGVFIKNNYMMEMSKINMISKGANWGEVKLEGNKFSFLEANKRKDEEDEEADDSKEIFDLNVLDIKNSLINKKSSELTLDFQLNDKKDEDNIYQIKFLFPSSSERLEVKDKNKRERLKNT
jgi:hypothetical protein